MLIPSFINTVYNLSFQVCVCVCVCLSVSVCFFLLKQGVGKAANNHTEAAKTSECLSFYLINDSICIFLSLNNFQSPL